MRLPFRLHLLVPTLHTPLKTSTAAVKALHLQWALSCHARLRLRHSKLPITPTALPLPQASDILIPTVCAMGTLTRSSPLLFVAKCGWPNHQTEITSTIILVGPQCHLWMSLGRQIQPTIHLQSTSMVRDSSGSSKFAPGGIAP